MGYKNKYLFGVTLMEVSISTIILAVTLAGMAGLFTSSRKWLTHSRSKMAGAELSRVFLSPLQMQVRQGESVPGANDGWEGTSNALYPGTRYCDQDPTHSQMPGNFCQQLQAETTLFGMPFEAEYKLETVPGTTVRRVRVVVHWTEKGP